MGFHLLHEAMLESVLAARDKFLRKPAGARGGGDGSSNNNDNGNDGDGDDGDEGCGVVLPRFASVMAAPVEMAQFCEEQFAFWQDVQGLDLSCFVPLAAQQALEKPQVRGRRACVRTAAAAAAAAAAASTRLAPNNSGRAQCGSGSDSRKHARTHASKQASNGGAEAARARSRVLLGCGGADRDAAAGAVPGGAAGGAPPGPAHDHGARRAARGGGGGRAALPLHAARPTSRSAPRPPRRPRTGSSPWCVHKAPALRRAALRCVASRVGPAAARRPPLRLLTRRAARRGAGAAAGDAGGGAGAPSGLQAGAHDGPRQPTPLRGLARGGRRGAGGDVVRVPSWRTASLSASLSASASLELHCAPRALRGRARPPSSRVAPPNDERRAVAVVALPVERGSSAGVRVERRSSIYASSCSCTGSRSGSDSSGGKWPASSCSMRAASVEKRSSRTQCERHMCPNLASSSASARPARRTTTTTT
eukprot:scaffold955_cov325-Prasinococcus_capsulatus_cf.AAC.10